MERNPRLLRYLRRSALIEFLWSSGFRAPSRSRAAENNRQRHGSSYRWFHTREHVNRPREILAELDLYFIIAARTFFPLPFLPFVFNNLVIGLSLVPREAPLWPPLR